MVLYGGVTVLLNILLWLSNMRWRGYEELSDTVQTLDRILHFKNSVSTSHTKPTALEDEIR